MMALELSQQTSSSEIKGNFHSNTHKQQNVIVAENRKRAENELEVVSGSTGYTDSANNIARNSSQEYAINGNLKPSDNKGNQTMPDGIQSQDFSGMSLENDPNSQTDNPVANIKIQPNHHHRHENSSSRSPSTAAPSSATREAETSAVDEQVTPSEMIKSNSKSMTNEQSSSNAATTISDKPQMAKNNSECDEETSDKTVNGVDGGEAKTIRKEDGLEDIIIPVPVLQRPPPCSGSGAQVKPQNGHSPFRSGNHQMRKRPVLVRKATPVKIETPVKLLTDKVKSRSRENSFAEEEEDELEAEGVSI